MSWNTGLQVNNLATKLNILSSSVITNPLTTTLNANTQSISNVSNIAIQSLKDSTGTNGTTDQVLAVAPSGLSVWKSPIVSTVFYVDGTNGNNANLGSQTFPFKTIQYALNQCVDATNQKYFTVYVVPFNSAIGYGENLTIAYKRVNLIGIQTTANSKSVATKSLTITATQSSGASLDVICVQNFLFIGDSATPTIYIGSNGGYSLYLNNCEIITDTVNVKNMYLRPDNVNTRYYFSNCIITNLAGSISTTMIDVVDGDIWLFNGNVITNTATTSGVQQLCKPLVLSSTAKLTGGIRNSAFDSKQDICIECLTNNNALPYTITNCSFTFTSINAIAQNTNACIVVGNQSITNIAGFIGNTFLNNTTSLTLAQVPFIKLNGISSISTNNSFNSKANANSGPTAIMYPVGNYGSNSLLQYYYYSGSSYSNASIYGFTATPNLTTTSTISYNRQSTDPNNTIINLAAATKTNVVGYDTTTGLLTYQPTSSGGVSSVSNGVAYSSGYLASIAGSTITVNTPNQNVNTGSSVSFNQLTIPVNASSSDIQSSNNNALAITSTNAIGDNANATLKVINTKNTNPVIMSLFSPNMILNQALDMWIGRELSAYYAVNWRFQTYNATQPSALNSMAFLGYAFNHAVYINNYGLRITQGSMSADTTATLLLDEDKAYKPSTSTWTISSDRRIKENIVDADLNICYNTLKKLPIRRFKWKDSYHTYPYDKAMEEKICDRPEKPNPIKPDLNKVDRHSIGVIADEFEKVFPKACVHRNDFGYDDCKAINIDQLIHSSFGAIKQLQIMVETLQRQVIDLQNK